MNQKGISSITIILIIVGVLIITGGIWTWQSQKEKPAVCTQDTKLCPDGSNVSRTGPNCEFVACPEVKDETANWKTFTSKIEGFTIRYPNEWTVEDSSNTNCAHSKLNGSDCRDRYDFVSPEGVRVRYVIHRDENNDRISCGVQSICESDNVSDLEKLNIQNFGQVYLVKLDGEKVALHKPLSIETTPKIGENKHSNFMIDFTLPSKTGGRFGLFITTSFAGYEPLQLQNITAEQFLNLKSVQQGILILKSVSY